MALIETEEAARRLARAIASDLSLYNEEKIVKGIIIMMIMIYLLIKIIVLIPENSNKIYNKTNYLAHFYSFKYIFIFILFRSSNQFSFNSN